jgi:hypothetical protein
MRENSWLRGLMLQQPESHFCEECTTLDIHKQEHRGLLVFTWKGTHEHFPNAVDRFPSKTLQDSNDGRVPVMSVHLKLDLSKGV